MSQAGFRFFNTKHIMASLPHPPLVTLQITNLGLICPCSRWHTQLQHPPKPTLNLKGPKTTVAAVSSAGGQAQAVLLGHGCVPSSMGLQGLQEMETEICKRWDPITSRSLAAVGRAPAVNVDWLSCPTYQSGIHGLWTPAFVWELLFLLFAFFLHRQWFV